MRPIFPFRKSNWNPQNHIRGFVVYTEEAYCCHMLTIVVFFFSNKIMNCQARRWVYCEFFYSGVDQQLFLGDNEFGQLLREMFPNLCTLKLCRPEWRAIRRMIGKPRRCSDAFLNEERESLEAKRWVHWTTIIRLVVQVSCSMQQGGCYSKGGSTAALGRFFHFFTLVILSLLIDQISFCRAKIRQIYDGSLMNVPPGCELPLRLPRPLVIGAKIYARVRSPKDGIYAGTIDAILPDSYRVVFDKEEMIPPMIIKDSEVMSAQQVCKFFVFLVQNGVRSRSKRFFLEFQKRLWRLFHNSSKIHFF